MASPSLQDGINEAGSPIKLLWRTNVAPWIPAVIEPEYEGWRVEQAAWQSGVSIMDLSYHMWDLFIDGPDATRMLSDLTANNYERFAVNQAKQLIPVTEEGLIVGDAILMRRAKNSYVVTGRPTPQNWLIYHAQQGGYNVDLRSDPDCRHKPDHTPRFFRYQIQGPLGQQLVERAFGGPLPSTPFFHASPVTLAGKQFVALRHGMAGQPGYEFIGDYVHHESVKEALMGAGEPLGLVQVGALAYPTAQAESGWIPAPTPAIYTAPSLLGYRQWLSLNTVDGRQPLSGSFYSENIEDYYVSPYELGYGRSISYNHDFMGRDALRRRKDTCTRTKVTLVFDPDEVREVHGDDLVFTVARHRVESAESLVGLTHFSAFNHPIGTILSLAIVENRSAQPGTQVSVAWGDHPGPGTAADADVGLPRVRATVAPAPYNEFARTQYRNP